MKKSDASDLVVKISQAYPRFPFSKGTVELYTAMLCDLDRDKARAAIFRLLAESKWPPSIAEIRDAVTLPDVAIPEFSEAWAEVMDVVRRNGSRYYDEWSHYAIAEAVKVVGLNTICHSDMVAVERKLFRETYLDIKRRIESAVRLPESLRMGVEKEALEAVEAFEIERTEGPKRRLEARKEIEASQPEFQSYLQKFAGALPAGDDDPDGDELVDPAEAREAIRKALGGGFASKETH